MKYFEDKLSIRKTGPENSSKLSFGKISGGIVQDFHSHALESLLIISGKDIINSYHYKGYDLALFCKSCRTNLPWKILGFIFFSLSLALLFAKIIKTKNAEKRTPLVLSGLWLLSSFLFILLISLDGFYTYPRFFLFVSPVAIIFLGFILEELSKLPRNIGWIIIFPSVLFLIFLNIRKNMDNFYYLKNSATAEEKIGTEDIFPNSRRSTLYQQMEIIDYIKRQYERNGFTVYIKSTHELNPAFWYHLNKKNIPFDEFGYDREKDKDIFGEGNYFLIFMTENFPKELLSKYEDAFEITKREDFGSLFLLRLVPRERSVTKTRQDISQKKISAQDKKIDSLLAWKNILAR